MLMPCATAACGGSASERASRNGDVCAAPERCARIAAAPRHAARGPGRRAAGPVPAAMVCASREPREKRLELCSCRGPIRVLPALHWQAGGEHGEGGARKLPHGAASRERAAIAGRGRVHGVSQVLQHWGPIIRPPRALGAKGKAYARSPTREGSRCASKEKCRSPV